MSNTFTFPDSGKVIEIERVPFLIIEMMRAAYEENYPGKPKEPTREIKDEDGNLLSVITLGVEPDVIRTELKQENIPSDQRAIYESDLKQIEDYLKAKREWNNLVAAAQWQASRLLYAKHLVTEPDIKEIQRALDDATGAGFDLKKQILAPYHKHNIPFPEELMNKWLYLWVVCARSTLDSAALNTWMQTGSKEARQQVAAALFPI